MPIDNSIYTLSFDEGIFILYLSLDHRILKKQIKYYKPEWLEEIKIRTKTLDQYSDLRWIERLYCLLNGINDRPSCKSCDNKVTYISGSYRTYCSKKCQVTDPDLNKQRSNKKSLWSQEYKKSLIEQRKRTLFKNYGVEIPYHSEEIQKKGRKTCLERYGVEHHSKTNEFKEKIQETNLKKYGVNWNVKLWGLQRSKAFRLKYGVDNVFQRADVIQDVLMKKYGVNNVSKLNWVQEKKISFWKEKYGVSNPAKNIKIISKIRSVLEEKGFWIPLGLQDEKNLYYRNVWIVTELEYKRMKQIIDLMGLRGRGYDLDHKYSIFQGFKDNIPEEIVGSFLNLQILPSSYNRSKGKSCFITKGELLEWQENSNIVKYSEKLFRVNDSPII